MPLSTLPLRGTLGHHTREFFGQLLDELSDGVYFVDRDRCITYWNRSAERISGYTADEVCGRSCHDNLLVHTNREGCQLCMRACPLMETFASGTCQGGDVFLRHKDGHRVPVSVRTSPIRNETGQIVGGVEVFSENSDKQAAIDRAADLERLALLDPLTGVGNRRFGEQVLNQCLAGFLRERHAFGALFLDLDHFKNVNDTLGHDAGDAVLRAVARTLASTIRSCEFLSRWGGEEFVILFACDDPTRAGVLASRCCGLVRSCSIPWEGQTIQPTVSIGAAMVCAGDTADSLMARADANLYLAKSGGRDRWIGP